MEFLKSTDIELNAAGYLVSKTTKKPVSHTAFVAQQRNADYVVKLAAAIKGKNFRTTKTDDLEAIKASVKASMVAAQVNEYVAMPTKPTSKVQDELTQLALDFVKYEDTKETNSKINNIMNEFNSINDIEKVGDYFSEGLVKLSKIYTIKEILSAVKSTSEILD
jgi:hypothetical protein